MTRLQLLLHTQQWRPIRDYCKAVAGRLNERVGLHAADTSLLQLTAMADHCKLRITSNVEHLG